MSSVRKRRTAEMLLLTGIAVCMLWKGGKAVDATWIVLALAVTLQCFGKHAVRKVPALIWWPGLAFVTLTVLSYAFSQTQNYGFDEVLQTVSLALIGTWVIRHAYGEGTDSLLHHVVRTIAFLGLIAAAIGVAVYVFQPVTRFVGTFFDYRFTTDYWPNAWAECALLVWPMLVLSLFARIKRDTYRDAVASAVTGFFFGCFLLSYSRGAMLAFGLQTVIVAMLLCVRVFGKPDWARLVSVGVVSALVAVATFLGVNLVRSNLYPVESVYSKVTFQSAEGTSSVSERSQFWSAAVWMAESKPLLGWGPYSFRFVQPSRQMAVLATSDHPHNVVLKAASERGVAAALVLIFLLAFILLTSLRRAALESRQKVSADSLYSRLCRIAALVGICGVLAHNMIDFNLQFMGIALPVVVLLALLLVDSTQPLKTAKTHWTQIVERVMAVAMLVIGLVEGGFLLTSSLGRHAERTDDVKAALYWYEVSDHELFSRDMLLSRAQLLINSQEYEEAGTVLGEYHKRNALDYRALKLAGDMASAIGEPQLAVQAYEQANDSARLNDISITQSLVRELIALKDNTGLQSRLPDIQRQMNDFGFAVEQNMHFIALSTNVESLVDLGNELILADPENGAMYRALIDHVTAKATEERAKFSARQPGLLWKASR